MKGLFVRIDPLLNRQLTQFCGQEGYKKGALVEKLIRGFLANRHEPQDPLQEAKRFGIDLTLLDENLKNSPTERLKKHADAHTFVEGIRGKLLKK